MRGSTILVAMFLSASLLVASAAQAMDFDQFDNMANADRQAFMDLQSVAAEAVLKQEGRNADAAKVHHLFNDISPGSALPLGEAELEMNNANARVRGAVKYAQNHNAPRVQVEVALIGTLKKNGIEMTPDFIRSFMQVTATFRPRHPPMVLPAAPARAAPPAASPPKPADDDPIGSGGFITPPAK